MRPDRLKAARHKTKTLSENGLLRCGCRSAYPQYHFRKPTMAAVATWHPRSQPGPDRTATLDKLQLASLSCGGLCRHT